MNTPSRSTRELARRLLEIEAAKRADTNGLLHEGVIVCEKLRLSLVRFAGRDGFAAVLRRAVVVAAAEVPSVGDLTVTPDCRMEGLEAMAPDGRNGGKAASAAITTHMLNLLETFIGRSLTLRLVRDAWPDETFYD